MGQGERGARKGEARKAEESRGRERSEARRAGRERWTPEPFKKNRPVGLFGPFDQSRSVNLWTIAGFCRRFNGLRGSAPTDSFSLSCEISNFLDKG